MKNLKGNIAVRLLQGLTLLVILASLISCQSKPAEPAKPVYPEYTNLVMCGYQGWFRAEGDGSGNGWVHFGWRDKFDPDNMSIDLWPEMSEYEKTYDTPFINEDGSTAQVFSSYDQSTTDLHFKWAKDYGIDGFFMQRFYGRLRRPSGPGSVDTILYNAVHAAKKHGRAVGVMYDLSGLRPDQDDCERVMEDWKHLVDDLDVLNDEEPFTYIHHKGKPLVTIWGIGFPDRSYNIRDIKILELIDFLQNDPVYGGNSVMLGVPTFFRELGRDCVPDTFLHEIIAEADLIMPWMVGRFRTVEDTLIAYHTDHIKKDIAWCKEMGVDYSPCIFPGFSWYNLSRMRPDRDGQLNAVPRLGGEFFWKQIASAIEAGSERLYIAMFDEIDEGTAIFKCSNNPPVNAEFIDYEGLPSDHYLKLTGMAGKILREEIPLDWEAYKMEEE